VNLSLLFTIIVTKIICDVAQGSKLQKKLNEKLLEQGSKEKNMWCDRHFNRSGGCSGLKFFECLLAELWVEQECVTSVFDTFVGGNCLENGLSNVNTMQVALMEKFGAGLSNFDERSIKLFQSLTVFFVRRLEIRMFSFNIVC
jgi:hypothetical protein